MQSQNSVLAPSDSVRVNDRSSVLMAHYINSIILHPSSCPLPLPCRVRWTFRWRTRIPGIGRNADRGD